MPNEIGELTRLQLLDVSQNYLKDLPETMGKMKSLQSLNLCTNKLCSLPKSLCHVRCLKDIKIDAEHFVYPPPEVAALGTEAIMKYLCEGKTCKVLGIFFEYTCFVQEYIQFSLYTYLILKWIGELSGTRTQENKKVLSL